MTPLRSLGDANSILEFSHSQGPKRTCRVDDLESAFGTRRHPSYNFAGIRNRWRDDFEPPVRMIGAYKVPRWPAARHP